MGPPPIPPRELRALVGVQDDPESFEVIGALARRGILEALPPEWAWDGARVLDLGCGPGRVLRHLTEEANRCEFLACDVNGDSVAWVERNLSPPFSAFRCGAQPPLPLEDASLDLVIAVSLFTHLADSWSAWLAEVARVLVPGGLLFATFHGPGVWHRGAGARSGFPFDERIGMHVEQPWQDFETGHGPAVWHGEWWLREHWGRGFEVLSLEAEGFAPPPSGAHPGQGRVVLRRGDAPVTAAGLERPADDPREAAAALHSARLTRIEAAAEVRNVRAELAAVRASRVMRSTESARRAWYRLKERRS